MSSLHWSLTRLALIAVTFLLATGLGLGQAVPYEVGSWPEAGYGNHRAIVHVDQKADAVRAHIEWRRRDRNPEQKGVLVFDATTGKRVANVIAINITREAGEVIFQPGTVPGDYQVYYLPYTPPGGGPFGSGGNYIAPEDTANAEWLRANGLTSEQVASGKWRDLHAADVVSFQTRSDFHRVDPMEIIATEEETTVLLAQHPGQAYMLFPEDRTRTIRMFEDLPQRWAQAGPSEQFTGSAQPNEYYAFQIGVWACRQPVADVTLEFSELKGPQDKSIPASELRCINLGGSDWLGRSFKKTFAVGEGLVRPLWIGVQVPEDAAGTYTGTVRVTPTGLPPVTIRLTLEVSGQVLEDRGDSDLWRMARLRWLDSKLAIDDEVIPPFTPITVNGDAAGLIGREIRFGDTGLPDAIASNDRQVLSAPIRFSVDSVAGAVSWSPGKTSLVKESAGTIERETTTQAAPFILKVSSKLEFDGCLTYRATVKAGEASEVSDIHLDVPIARDVARFMMGMSRRGGLRPADWDWKWDIERADNMVWLGDVDAGLQLKLMGPQDVWQLTDLTDTGIPDSWGNGGRGGCRMFEDGDTVMLRAFTGPRSLAAGESLEFRFRFLITPFKPIDPNHWNWRYGNPRTNANILHVHHGVSQNPYINYPFITADQMKALVDDVRSIRTSQTDLGVLTYPARGNIDLRQGALHLWVTLNFDPAAGQPRDARFNQQLFSLDFPNQDQFAMYWNVDDRGMRTYTRRGAPELNKYPVLFGTHSQEWRQGQRHLLTLSWGERLAVFVDGKQLQAANYKGTLENTLEDAILKFSGSGFIIDAIKITDQPHSADAEASPVLDDHTLLLDTFTRWDGGTQTSPEQSANGAPGQFEGTIESQAGEYGKEILLSSRELPVPPKGVNIYYTVRELSNHVAEMWALRSLGDEIFKTGGVSIYTDPEAAKRPSEGYSWLREHLVTGYETAWRQIMADGQMDAAIATQGLSRWHNYYVEGMRWLMEYTGIDGLYLDGIGYDREIMKRIAKVMSGVDPASRINFHSGDGWNPPWDQGRHISPASQYMEHFPYISNLWFGELFDYNMPPDYWLVEISGIPFGITSEMLNYQTGGNPYRGMLYGMTGRQHPSVSAMWDFWDSFGIQDAEMLGYWDRDCPVRTDSENVLATVYRKPGKSLVALASWPKSNENPRAVAARAEKPPVIDGSLSAGEWETAAMLTNFTTFGGEGLAPEQTQVYVTHDARHLYIGFRCDHAAGGLKADTTARDSNVWEDDAVEIFVQPDVGSVRYLQFVGNSAGVFADNENQKMEWNGDWVYEASAGEGYWEGELRVPFTSLGLSAAPEEIALNICRDQQLPQPHLSCWSPAMISFHDTSVFGRLTFAADGRPSTRQIPVREGEASPGTTPVSLIVDWEALRLDPAKTRVVAPEIRNFQPASEFRPTDAIGVEPGKGWLLVLEQTDK